MANTDLGDRIYDVSRTLGDMGSAIDDASGELLSASDEVSDGRDASPRIMAALAKAKQAAARVLIEIAALEAGAGGAVAGSYSVNITANEPA